MPPATGDRPDDALMERAVEKALVGDDVSAENIPQACKNLLEIIHGNDNASHHHLAVGHRFRVHGQRLQGHDRQVNQGLFPLDDGSVMAFFRDRSRPVAQGDEYQQDNQVFHASSYSTLTAVP